MSGVRLRICSLAWGLMRWQWRRCLGVGIVALCLTAALAFADLSYSTAHQQTRISVEATYRGFQLQIVPDESGLEVPGAVAVQADEVRVRSGGRSVDVGRSRVGLDSVSANEQAAAFGVLVSGRHPASADEVSLSEVAAARLAVSVGERVRVDTDEFNVVGVFTLPSRPQWAAMAGLVTPAIVEPTAWLANEIPESLGESGYRLNGVRFETKVATEKLDQGP